MCPQGVIDFRKFHYNKNCKCFAFICFASFHSISLLFTIFHFTWVYFWICHPNSGTCIASSVTECYCLAINFRHLLALTMLALLFYDRNRYSASTPSFHSSAAIGRLLSALPLICTQRLSFRECEYWHFDSNGRYIAELQNKNINCNKCKQREQEISKNVKSLKIVWKKIVFFKLKLFRDYFPQTIFRERNISIEIFTHY